MLYENDEIFLCFLLLVPGPPSSVHFPNVTWTTARIVWSPPIEPNGVITFYRVTYFRSSDPTSLVVVDDRIPASTGEKTLTDLTMEQVYVFKVTARTSLDWGEDAEERVRTVINRSKNLAFTQVFH